MAFTDRKKKKEKRSWDNIKNQLRSEFKKTKENVKDTIQDIKKQFNEEEPSRKIIKTKKKLFDSSLELFCPFCENPIPKELKPTISDSNSIVCENCGTEIKKSSFFKDYSFPN